MPTSESVAGGGAPPPPPPRDPLEVHAFESDRDRDRPSTEDASTVPAETDLGASRRGAVGRAVGLVVMTVLVLLVGLGVAGPTSGHQVSVGGGYQLEVEHPARTRPGLAAPWSIQVTRLSGEAFDGPVTIAITGSYLDLFDENGTDPQPDSSTADGEMVWWTFEAPEEGPTFAASFDLRTQPSWQRPQEAIVMLEVNGDVVTSVRFTTYVIP
jgi:hypothetical protein